MSQPIYESMTRLKVAGRTIRIWRDEPKLSEIDNTDLMHWQGSINGMLADDASSRLTDAELLAAASSFDRVAAVEVLAENGNGILKYNSWP